MRTQVGNKNFHPESAAGRAKLKKERREKARKKPLLKEGDQARKMAEAQLVPNSWISRSRSTGLAVVAVAYSVRR